MFSMFDGEAPGKAIALAIFRPMNRITADKVMYEPPSVTTYDSKKNGSQSKVMTRYATIVARGATYIVEWVKYDSRGNVRDTMQEEVGFGLRYTLRRER
jgi:hypothetical protein